jgi:hypothetical protein
MKSTPLEAVSLRLVFEQILTVGSRKLLPLFSILTAGRIA